MHMWLKVLGPVSCLAILLYLLRQQTAVFEVDSRKMVESDVYKGEEETSTDCSETGFVHYLRLIQQYQWILNVDDKRVSTFYSPYH